MEYQMKDLVNRCKNEDRKAKGEIIERLMPLIISSIKKYYFGAEEFSDLVQEGCLKILKEIERFDEEKGVPFLGYIKLQLKFFYMEKRKKVRKEVSLNNQIDTGDDRLSFIDLLVDESANVEESLVKEENYYILTQALKTLTNQQMEIIKLYYSNHLNMRQIAAFLGVHYQTVVKRKERALRRMRQAVN